ncbi:MAG: RDD family protein [Myxococcales bacterium]|nr:RDD family protein [Myxococcota bacterium]MDW8281916.1 RDD family protein [Myxococcales bacterium]
MVDALPTSAATLPEPARYYVAGFWRRAAAAAVDLLLLCPVFALLGTLVSLVFDRPLPRLREIGPDLLVSALVEGSLVGEALLLLCSSLLLLYFFVFHALRGQTPGKRLLGLAVIDIYGERPGLARTLLRTAGYVVSAALFSLGFFWIGFDREKRALHDWLAGTYVVLAR